MMDTKKKLISLFGSKNPGFAGVKKKFGYNVTDRCRDCGMDFGDHRAKPPHVSMPPEPPCRGFRPACDGTSPVTERQDFTKSGGDFNIS